MGFIIFLILIWLTDWAAKLNFYYNLGDLNLVDLINWPLKILPEIWDNAKPPPARNLVLIYIVFSEVILFVLVCIWVSYSLLTWGYSPSGASRYQYRRLIEKLSGPALLLVAASLLLASIPVVASMISGWVASVGPLSAAFGIATGLWGLAQTMRDGSRTLRNFAVIISAALLIYGFGLICFQLAVNVEPFLDDWSWLQFFSVLCFAVATGIFVNINGISIHRFYRDRLMEAFLPDVEIALRGVTGPAHAADKALLKNVLACNVPVAPYQIINANVILVNSDDHRRRVRGGDNFILTPQYCGSSATGWRPTKSIIKAPFTLATAMAISGAAVNPNTGSGGKGLTRSRMISLLMALLNLRLGYWIPNPKRGCRWFSPNRFIPGIMQAFGIHH